LRLVAASFVIVPDISALANLVNAKQLATR
jgi:hypothetical protein